MALSSSLCAAAAKSSRDQPAQRIRYFNPNGPRDGNGFLGFGEVDGNGKKLSPEEFRRRRQETTEPREVMVLDARAPDRGGLDAWNLEDHGFCFVAAPTPITDFKDKKLIQSEYYSRVAEVVKAQVPNLTNAFPMSHIVRTEDPANLTAAYAKFAHSDFGPAFEPIFRRMLTTRFGVPEREAQECGLCALNLWAPFDHPAYKDPLCMLDASSVHMEKETVLFLYAGTGGKSDATTYQGQDQAPGIGPIFSPNHRWVFCPDMQPSEAILFKQSDFRKESRSKTCFHNSFPDTFHDAWKDCPRRRSIEVRLLVTWAPQHHGGEQQESKL